MKMLKRRVPRGRDEPAHELRDGRAAQRSRLDILPPHHAWPRVPVAPLRAVRPAEDVPAAARDDVLPRMKILMPCYEYPPIGGGGAKVVCGLAEELVRQGHEVDVVTMGWRDHPRFERAGGVGVHRVPCLRLREDRSNPAELLLYLLPAVAAARRLLRASTYDVCNAHFILPDAVVMLLTRGRADPPLVVTAHGSDVPGYNPDRFKLLHRLIRPLWRRAARGADRIVCPSATLEDLVRRHDPAADTAVVPNGFDAARFRPRRERARRILVVSRLFPRKGVQHLVEAFLGIDTDFELHVVGDGPHLPALRAMAAGAGRRIEFWGWLDNADPRLRELYESSAIFCLPSEAENFPVCLLEAMAAGLAIVTTRGTGCADVVGDAALLVAPKDVRELRDALALLVADEGLRVHLARAARSRLEDNFTWPAVARRYLDLYRELAPPRALAGPEPIAGGPS